MIRTLKSRDELAACRQLLKERGLDFSEPKAIGLWRWPYQIRYRLPFPNADQLKSWDVYYAINAIESYAPDRDTPILDMGCYNSEVVYGLSRLGYQHVHGCDLNPMCRWMPFWHKIKYRWADLTKTPYPDRSFGVITCISVIEHGVPLEAFVDEVTRLIRPGGLLLFSTDYDASGAPHDVDPETRLFGQPWTLFTPETLEALVDRFRQRGFLMADPEVHDPAHEERSVNWQGQEYTFIMVGLRAPA